MVKNRKAITFATAFLFFLTLPLFALDVPKMTGRVNDYAEIIRPTDEAEIEDYLQNLENTTGIQITPPTVTMMSGRPSFSSSSMTCGTRVL